MIDYPEQAPDLAPPRYDVAVVGGGAAGALTAIHLLESRSFERIVLVERSPAIGEGLAYGTRDSRHLLNVPAGRLSAVPEAPDDFLDWLRETYDDRLDGAAFVPRNLFGEYLEHVLRRAQERWWRWTRLDRVRAEALAISEEADGVAVVLAGGERLAARAAVLALGNLPTRNPTGLRELESSPCYIANPWAAGALERVPEGDVLLIGTGLTAVDVALTLSASDVRLHAVSRHGLLPNSHLPGPAATVPVFGGDPPLGSIVRALRRAAADGSERGDGWRPVVDGVRANTQRIWQGLTVEEQDRVLRHAVTYWNVHRHRMAPATATQIEQLVAAGRLDVHAGRIVALAAEPSGAVVVSVRPRGGEQLMRLRVAAVVNCTGPALRLVDGKLPPLVESLLESGLARLDVHGIGLQTASDGALIDPGGAASDRLYTLGTLRRGTLWESTAIPELRAQAQQLARRLADGVPQQGPIVAQQA